VLLTYLQPLINSDESSLANLLQFAWISPKSFMSQKSHATDSMNLKLYRGRKKERYCALNYSTIIQRAAALAGPQECVSEMRQVYQHRRDLAVNLLKKLGRYVYTPHGAFYILVDVSSPFGTARRGRQFALDMLRERNIAVAPGSTFGSVADNYVRVSLAASDDEIVRGVREICTFADR
jgi:aspartate/methionine/tyrosine aminotransferase